MTQSKMVADISTGPKTDSTTAADEDTSIEAPESTDEETTPSATDETAAADTDSTSANGSGDDDPQPTGDSEADDAPLPLDQVFGILKNQRRRRVLRMLQQADDKISLSDLAEQIAAWENDKEVKQITSSERKRVYVGLYQCHLPKMDSMGVIDFNKPRGTVELGDNMEVMYKYLETADADEEPDWHRYSTALSVGGASALAVALLVDPMTTLPVIDFSVAGLLVAFLIYGLVCVSWGRKQA